jgi:hypothetical protein
MDQALFRQDDKTVEGVINLSKVSPVVAQCTPRRGTVDLLHRQLYNR